MAKSKLFVLITFLTITIQVWAAKAMPTPIVCAQPDGTTISVILHGDENLAWFTTTDGVFVSRQNKSFYVSELRNGRLVPTNVLVHNVSERTMEEISVIANQDRVAIQASLDSAWKDAKPKHVSIADRTPKFVSHTGSPKILVVLAEYSDKPFTLADPKKSFDQFFNAEGENNHVDYGNSENRNYYSVREYFNTISRGQYKPDFTVVGPVTVQNMDVYGGSNEDSANDENAGQLVSDAVTAALNVVNLSDYDNDNDGAADIVYIIYSGYGQNSGGDANTVWAKTGSFGKEIGGTKISWYSCASELNLYESYFTSRNTAPYINGIGVACHEFSHALGLPDIYPTSSSAIADNQEMEYWDIMDGGTYVSNGFRPKDFTAWECEVMGWSSIEQLTADCTDLKIKPLLDGGKAYKFVNPAKEDEYFVLENIQKSGLNRSMPGHGLVVYHVNFPYESVSMGGCPNNVKGKPGMAIVPADGACLSSYLDYTGTEYRESHGGDPFPGTTGLDVLNYSQDLPNYVWQDGEEKKVKQGVYNITENEEEGIVTLSYTTDYDAYLQSVATVEKNIGNTHASTIFDLQGRVVVNPNKGIYIMNGKKVVK